MNLIAKTIRFLESIQVFTKNAFFSFIYYKTFKVYLCNHLTIGIKILHDSQTKFPHPVGIVIGKKVKLGKNCKIYQNVTIGTKETINFEKAEYPTIGNNVTIFANSVIFGNITIGDNSIIGAGSVVFSDVPENSIVAGNPSKIIQRSAIQQ